MRSHFACTLVALIVSLACGGWPACAAPLVVSTIDGTIGTFSLTVIPAPANAPKGNVLDFTFGTAATFSTLFNSAGIPGGPIPTTLGPVSLTVASANPVAFPPNRGGGQIEFFGFNQGAVEDKTLSPSPAQGGGAATFQLTLEYGEVVEQPGLQDTLVLAGRETFGISTTPSYDFTPFQTEFPRFTFALTSAQPNVDIADVIRDGGTVQGAGSFTETSVPEPGSLILLCAGLASCYGLRLLRRLAAHRPC
jgi:hypothetical protein